MLCTRELHTLLLLSKDKQLKFSLIEVFMYAKFLAELLSLFITSAALRSSKCDNAYIIFTRINKRRATVHSGIIQNLPATIDNAAGYYQHSALDLESVCGSRASMKITSRFCADY